jgi:hypothetical protein
MDVGRNLRLRYVHRRDEQPPGSRLSTGQFMVAESDRVRAWQWWHAAVRWSLISLS